MYVPLRSRTQERSASPQPSKREKQRQNDETTELEGVSTLSFNKSNNRYGLCRSIMFSSYVAHPPPQVAEFFLGDFLQISKIITSPLFCSILQDFYIGILFIMGFSKSLLLLSTALLALSLVGLNAQLIPETHLVSPCSSKHPYILIDLLLSPCGWCHNT